MKSTSEAHDASIICQVYQLKITHVRQHTCTDWPPWALVCLRCTQGPIPKAGQHNWCKRPCRPQQLFVIKIYSACVLGGGEMRWRGKRLLGKRKAAYGDGTGAQSNMRNSWKGLPWLLYRKQVGPFVRCAVQTSQYCRLIASWGCCVDRSV